MAEEKKTTLDMEEIIKKAKDLYQELLPFATYICGYAFHDNDGVPKETILKYLSIGAQWQKEQMMKDAVLSWVDIDVIYTIMCGLNEKEFPRYSVAFYKEVLRLYNESNKIFNE